MTNLTTNLIALFTLLTFTLISFNSNAQLHVVKPNGNVGIGTAAPQNIGTSTQNIKLDVKGGNTILRGRQTTVGTDAGDGTAIISIGRGRTGSGAAVINLHPFGDKGAIGRLSSGKTNSGAEYTSFQNSGNGFFSIRNYAATADMLFQTPALNAAGDGIAKLTIKADGKIGIGTENPTALLQVQGVAAKPGGGDWAGLSDKRAKKNINEYTKGLEEVLNINPVTYNYNGKAGIADTETTYVGIVAQEFAKIEPQAVSKYEYTDSISNKTEEYIGIDASSIRYMLVNAIKDLNSIIELQNEEIADLKEIVSKVNSTGAATNNPEANEINVLLEGNGVKSALLAQNMPNPFTTATRIEYFIPANSRNARMSFRDMSGKEIKRVDIIEEGIGAIELTAKDLATGIYSYVLYTNGNIVDSKKMIVK